MIPVVSVVGKSNVGKTTFLEQVVRRLKGKGYRVAVIKHAHHIEIDHPGKDSWRYAQAGADTVAVSGPGKTAVITFDETEKQLEEVAAMITGVDIIIVEGYKHSGQYKIEVYRKEAVRELISSPEKGLIAVVTDTKLDTDLPQLPLDRPEATADFLEQRFLR